jgi:peptidoglycan/xylan/chitin deacetylase (PgdA/CDA1 family)
MIVIPILVYHSISADPPGWIAPFTVTPQVFAHHLDLVLESDRTPMTVSELQRALRGHTRLPSKPVVVTFDDGYADFAEAASTLASRNMPSTLYVTTGALQSFGRRPTEAALPPARMLEWSQLAKIEDTGVEIGAHTHTHPQLDTISIPAAAEEIRRCKDMLEDELGHKISSFAYPFGYHSRRILREVQAVGYESACAVKNALSSESDQVFALSRLLIRADTTSMQMAAWLAGHGAPIAPQRERLRTKAWRTYRRLQRYRGFMATTTRRHAASALQI